MALCLWLAIPVFSRADSFSYSCHQLVDRFRDHLIGCGHEPLCIRCHNTLCDIIYFGLLEDNSEVRQEQGVSGESSSCPGDIFHPDFHNWHPTFDIYVRSAVHSGVITHSTLSPGFVALKGEMEKDAQHRRLVEAAGCVFFPLVVGSGLPPVLRCSALLLKPPQSIMLCLSVHPSVILWSGCAFNSTGIMLRRFFIFGHFTLTWRMIGWKPVLDWMMLLMMMTLSSSLDSPPADATDCVFYAIDVCNRFYSLSIENSQPSDGVQC